MLIKSTRAATKVLPGRCVVRSWPAKVRPVKDYSQFYDERLPPRWSGPALRKVTFPVQLVFRQVFPRPLGRNPACFTHPYRVTMSVQSDRIREQMSALLGAGVYHVEKGRERRGLQDNFCCHKDKSQQIVRSGGETKGQARSNMRVHRNTSATPLQLHIKFRAHLDQPNPYMIVRTKVGKCALTKHAQLSRS